VPLFAVHYHASRVEGHAGHISADADRFVGSPFSVHVLPDFTILHELCMPIVHSRDERSRLLRGRLSRDRCPFTRRRLADFARSNLRSFQRSKQPLTACDKKVITREVPLRWKGGSRSAKEIRKNEACDEGSKKARQARKSGLTFA